MKKQFLLSFVFLAFMMGFYSCETEDTTIRPFEHHVGEPYGGGIVFHVYYGLDGKEHGLIVSLKDLATEAAWGEENTLVENCNSTWNGKENTLALLALENTAYTAANLCKDYSFLNFSDWYLPSIDELNLLMTNKLTVNQSLAVMEGAEEINLSSYWSSTQTDENNAISNNNIIKSKEEKLSIRAIRTF